MHLELGLPLCSFPQCFRTASERTRCDAEEHIVRAVDLARGRIAIQVREQPDHFHGHPALVDGGRLRSAWPRLAVCVAVYAT